MSESTRYTRALESPAQRPNSCCPSTSTATPTTSIESEVIDPMDLEDKESLSDVCMEQDVVPPEAEAFNVDRQQTGAPDDSLLPPALQRRSGQSDEAISTDLKAQPLFNLEGQPPVTPCDSIPTAPPNMGGNSAEFLLKQSVKPALARDNSAGEPNLFNLDGQSLVTPHASTRTALPNMDGNTAEVLANQNVKPALARDANSTASFEEAKLVNMDVKPASVPKASTTDPLAATVLLNSGGNSKLLTTPRAGPRKSRFRQQQVQPPPTPLCGTTSKVPPVSKVGLLSDSIERNDEETPRNIVTPTMPPPSVGEPPNKVAALRTPRKPARKSTLPPLSQKLPPVVPPIERDASPREPNATRTPVLRSTTKTTMSRTRRRASHEQQSAAVLAVATKRVRLTRANSASSRRSARRSQIRPQVTPKAVPQSVERSSTSSAKGTRSAQCDNVFREAERLGLREGAAVFAEWTSDNWYNGTITRRYESKGRPLFDVDFDDGDKRTELALTMISVIAGEATIDLGTENAYDMWELFEKRCKNCAMCRTPACGKCDVCIENQSSTCLKRKVCYFQVCSRKYSPIQKGQPIPGMPGWRFYIDTPRRLAKPLQKAPLPQLGGLCVFLGEKAFSSIETALAASGRNDVAELRHEFYTKKLGLSEFQTTENHCLVGKGYHRRWINHMGQESDIYGEIVQCHRSVFADGATRQFTIKYSEASLSRLQTRRCLIKPGDDNGKKFGTKVCEDDAWSGTLSYYNPEPQSSLDLPLPIKTLPPHIIKWLVPRSWDKEAIAGSHLYAVVFTHGRHEIRLEPRDSNFGLGLFAKCEWLGPESSQNKNFVLKPGELLDLGPYGPLQATDWKTDSVSLLKNFMFEHKPEIWNFEASRQGGVIDITGDGTGKLHQTAIENPIVYANECSRGATPSLTADFDPTGAVHYMMGHAHLDEGAFRLEPRKWRELTIDYGNQYEKVRVRENYSRLPEEKLHAVKNRLLRDDEETVEQFGVYSANDVEDCLTYIEYNLSSLLDNCPQRALLGVVALLKRLDAMHEEFKDVVVHQLTPDSFCDNGYTALDLCLDTRARGLLSEFNRHFETDEDLHQALVGSCAEIMRTLGYDSNQSPADLREKITALESV